MSDEIDILQDDQGFERRCGLLLPPKNDVLLTADYATLADPIYSDADIKKGLQDPDRVKMRKLFDLTWIRKGNQQQFGSCNPTAACSALSKKRFMAGIRDRLVLSGAYLYSKINGHRDQGSQLKDSMAAIMKWGAPPVEMVKPNMIYPELIPAGADEEAAKHKGLVCYHTADLQAFKSAIYIGHFGIVAVQVTKTGYTKVDSDGIAGFAHGPGNHAVHVDDLAIKKDEIAYDSPGNWGETYGVDGRCYMFDEHFEETSQYHMFYIIPAVTEKE